MSPENRLLEQDTVPVTVSRLFVEELLIATIGASVLVPADKLTVVIMLPSE